MMHAVVFGQLILPKLHRSNYFFFLHCFVVSRLMKYNCGFRIIKAWIFFWSNERATNERSFNFFCDQLNERSLNFWRWSRSRSSITFCWSNGKSARGWVLHSFFFLLFSLIRSRPDSFHIKGYDFCPLLQSLIFIHCLVLVFILHSFILLFIFIGARSVTVSAPI